MAPHLYSIPWCIKRALHSPGGYDKGNLHIFCYPSGLTVFVACRLVLLNKNPGVRPIGICETIRRIISKAILKVTRVNILSAVGPLQLCAGQDAGCEAAVHAMRSVFDDEDTEGVLLIDAKNAFNSLNRAAALHNIQVLCPCLAPTLINLYRTNTELFVDGESILSQEGTTQGDPLAMAMYALGILPLISAVSTAGATQTWYADDATAGGHLTHLRKWWDQLRAKGPAFGYFVNNLKTWLIVKEEHLTTAEDTFKDTGICITCSGRRHLGAALRSRTFVEEYAHEKVLSWKSELERLALYAKSEPHAAFAALTHGFMSRWTYLLQTIEGLAPLLQPLEDTIRLLFLPSLTGRDAPTDDERELLALPAHLGGLGLVSPTTLTKDYDNSLRLYAPLSALITLQSADLGDTYEKQREVKATLRAERRRQQETTAAVLKARLPSHLQSAADHASEKGSSSWVTALPIADHGFTLHKGAFRDALCLWYNWTLPHLPTSCVCSAGLTVEHALTCPTGGYTFIRHNEIHDNLEKLLTEVCYDVCIEPHLQPLSSESFTARSVITGDSARLDVAASGFWGGRFERTFCNVRCLIPTPPQIDPHS